MGDTQNASDEWNADRGLGRLEPTIQEFLEWPERIIEVLPTAMLRNLMILGLTILENLLLCCWC